MDVVAILISSGISGTINSALLAKNEIGSDRVVVIDSQTAAMATELHVLAAAWIAEADGSLEEVKEGALKAQALLENAEDTFSPDETFLDELSPAIGTHVGPGTLAIALMHSDYFGEIGNII